GPKPLVALASSLLPLASEAEVAALEQSLAQETNYLVQHFAKREPLHKAALVIDQAEELFTMHGDPDTARRFLLQLANFLSASGVELRIILTVRSEFEPRFAESDLKPYWRRNGRFLLHQMR